jgi:hypothetical protein
MYRPIDPIELNSPLPAHAIAAFATAQQVRQPISPEGRIFMRSQNGPAKAKLLNMHTKALIRPFDKSGGDKGSFRAPCRLGPDRESGP